MRDLTEKIGKDLSFVSVEAYNLLRTNLSFMIPGKNDCRIIGVTSTSPREGKSYTAINLACSIAWSGKKVLLIDADMRKPTIHKVLNINVKPGLSTAIADVDETCVQRYYPEENMDVLSAGEIPPNPSELIGSENMNKLLTKLAANYDTIILDLPPIGVVSDGLSVSPYLDGMMVVVRHNMTRRSDITDTMRQLKLSNVNILGFVYNAFSDRGDSYYKYKYKRGSYSRRKYYYEKNYYRTKEEEAEEQQ